MAFKFYDGSHSRKAHSAAINRKGRLTLNPSTVREFALADCEYAILGLDEVSGAIAIRFVDSIGVVGSRMVRFNRGYLHLPAVAFLRYFRIPFEKEPQHYNVSKNDEGLIVLDRVEDEREKG